MAHIAIIHFYWNRLCPVKDADPGGEVSFDSVRLHQSHVTEKGQYFDRKSRPDRPSGPIKYAGSGLMKSIRDVMIRTAGPPPCSDRGAREGDKSLQDLPLPECCSGSSGVSSLFASARWEHRKSTLDLVPCGFKRP